MVGFIEQDVMMLTPELLLLLIAIIIWSAVWKAIAMWHSARNKQIAWFVIFCIFNTMGLLEILYLGLWQRDRNNKFAVKESVTAAAKPVVKKVKKKK